MSRLDARSLRAIVDMDHVEEACMIHSDSDSSSLDPSRFVNSNSETYL